MKKINVSQTHINPLRISNANIFVVIHFFSHLRNDLGNGEKGYVMRKKSFPVWRIMGRSKFVFDPLCPLPRTAAVALISFNI